MKLKYSILLIFIISILGWNFYNCCEESTVEINERNFLVNNEIYFIKGVCYDPVPLGYKKRSFDNIDEDLKLMVEAGVNTIK